MRKKVAYIFDMKFYCSIWNLPNYIYSYFPRSSTRSTEYCPSKNSRNWRNRENDGVYIVFSLTLRRPEIWYDSSKKHFAYYKTWLANLHIIYILFFIFLTCFKRLGSVLSSPELHVDPNLFIWYYAPIE